MYECMYVCIHRCASRRGILLIDTHSTCAICDPTTPSPAMERICTCHTMWMLPTIRSGHPPNVSREINSSLPCAITATRCQEISKSSCLLWILYHSHNISYIHTYIHTYTYRIRNWRGKAFDILKNVKNSVVEVSMKPKAFKKGMLQSNFCFILPGT